MSSIDRPILGLLQLESACSDIFEKLTSTERPAWRLYRSNKDNLRRLEARLTLSEWGGDPSVPLYTYAFQSGDYQANDPEIEQLNIPGSLRHPDAAIAALEDRIVECALARLRTNQPRQRQVEATREKLIAEKRDQRSVIIWQDFVKTDEEFKIAIETARLPDGTYPHADVMARELGLSRAELRKRAKALGLEIRKPHRPKNQ